MPVHKNAITSLCARTARAKANCSHRQICPQTLDGSLCWVQMRMSCGGILQMAKALSRAIRFLRTGGGIPWFRSQERHWWLDALRSARAFFGRLPNMWKMDCCPICFQRAVRIRCTIRQMRRCCLWMQCMNIWSTLATRHFGTSCCLY